jgi:hypothetical protein
MAAKLGRKKKCMAGPMLFGSLLFGACRIAMSEQ